jgi:hypothetical protein
VEGQSRRLTGTAESQYEGWRKILKEINQLETEITTTDVTDEPFRISDQ